MNGGHRSKFCLGGGILMSLGGSLIAVIYNAGTLSDSSCQTECKSYT